MPGPEEIIPVVAVVACSIIPVTVILTKHQQKMTMLLRQGQPQPHEILPVQAPVVDHVNMQYEVQQLRSMVSSLAISVDNLKDEVRASQQLQERVKIER